MYRVGAGREREPEVAETKETTKAGSSIIISYLLKVYFLDKKSNDVLAIQHITSWKS